MILILCTGLNINLQHASFSPTVIPHFLFSSLFFFKHLSLLHQTNIEYGAVPVVGVGHSCGSLLHMLITSLFPDTPRAANALISYNNRGVSEAVPLFEELIVPLFSDKDRNGSDLMKAMIGVAREKYNGKL